MADKELKIGVNFETSGAPDAEKELSKLRAQIKGATDDTAAYNAKLKEMAGGVEPIDRLAESQKELAKETNNLAQYTKDSLAPALAHLKDTTEEGGKKFKLFGEHGKEVKKVITELTRDFPAAGLALKFFTNAIGGTLTVAVIAFRLIKTHIDEVNRSLDEMGKKAEQPFNKIWEHQQAAITSTIELLAKYKSELAHAGDESDPIGKHFEQRRKILEAEAEVEKNLRTSRGQGTADIDSRLAQQLLALQSEERNVRVRVQGRLQGAAAAATGPAEAASVAYLKNQETINNFGPSTQRGGALFEAKKEADTALEDAQKKHFIAMRGADALTASGHVAEAAVVRKAANEVLKKHQQNADFAASELAQAQKDLAAALKHQKEITDRHIEAQKKLTDATNAADANAKKIPEMGREIGGSAQLNRIKDRARVAGTGIGNLDTEFRLVDKYKADPNSLTPDEQNLLTQEGSMLYGKPVGLEAAIKAFAAAKDNESLANQYMERLVGAMMGFGQQAVANAQKLQALEQKILQVEKMSRIP